MNFNDRLWVVSTIANIVEAEPIGHIPPTEKETNYDREHTPAPLASSRKNTLRETGYGSRHAPRTIHPNPRRPWHKRQSPRNAQTNPTDSPTLHRRTQPTRRFRVVPGHSVSGWAGIAGIRPIPAEPDAMGSVPIGVFRRFAWLSRLSLFATLRAALRQGSAKTLLPGWATNNPCEGVVVPSSGCSTN